MKLPLAPLDYYFARPNLFAIQFAFRYRHELDPHRLSLAWRQVAEAFVPLRMVLERTGDRLQLVSGSVPSLESIDGNHPVLGLRTSVGEPLFRIGLSGSVLSLAMSHGLGDGHSFFLVLQALTQAYQGRDFTTPDLDRTVLEPRSLPASFDLADLPDRTSYFLGEAKHESHHSVERFIVDRSREGGASESDTLMAKLFQRYGDHGEYQGDYYLRFPVDFRRLLPELSPLYFGNAVRDALVRLPRHPRTYSIAELAGLVAREKSAIDENRVRDTLAAFARLRSQHGIEAFQRLIYPGVLVSNLMRLPLEQLDFGNGVPESVETGEGTPRLAVLQKKSSEEIAVTYYLPLLS